MKNLFTSDILFDPMIPENVKRRREYAALLREGTMPVPKEMAFPVPKDATEWLELYDIMRFPDERNVVPVAMSTAVAVETTRRLMGEENVAPPLPQASVEKKKKKRKEMTKRELPEVGVNEPVKIEADHRGEIHVYAESDDDVRIHEVTYIDLWSKTISIFLYERSPLRIIRVSFKCPQVESKTIRYVVRKKGFCLYFSSRFRVLLLILYSSYGT